MKIAAISDVHVKQPFDEADKLLCQFLTHPIVKSSDYIILLGDIFDLMCGPHEEYLKKFAHIFDLLDQLQTEGKKVLFFEGNHDVHLKQLFRKRWPKGEIVPEQYQMILEIAGKSYYFSHGDEHEVDNKEYQKYKSFILSTPLRFVANYIMPFWLLNYLGERASKMSRKRGSREYNEELVRERFRKGVFETTGGSHHFILGGHSHVKDHFSIHENSIYLNNGFALKSKSFIFIENHVSQFLSLS